MTEGESDAATPAPLFEEKEPVAQKAEEALPQPIRGGYFDRTSKLREALHRRSS